MLLGFRGVGARNSYDVGSLSRHMPMAESMGSDGEPRRNAAIFTTVFILTIFAVILRIWECSKNQDASYYACVLFLRYAE